MPLAVKEFACLATPHGHGFWPDRRRTPPIRSFQGCSSTALRNVLFGPSQLKACDSTGAPLITLLGGSMDADGSCGAERTEQDPGLANRLAFDGGFTPTLALLPDSVAIDAGTDAGCSARDRRGAERPLDGDGNPFAQCDVGAYERAPPGVFSDGFEVSLTPGERSSGRAK